MEQALKRMVLHVDMDAFFAAIEERDNPQFAGLPIVVGADPKEGRGRGVVSTANYQARRYGIKSGMPISWAYRAAPFAVFLPVDFGKYRKVSQNIMRILRKCGNGSRFEQVSVDEGYLEIKDKQKEMSYKKGQEVATRIKKEIWKEERLTCSVGIGPNKLVAKIASNHNKPDGLTIIKPSRVQSFLGQKKC